MLGTPFNHEIIRKCVIAMGTLFNNIQIEKSPGVWITVPIMYSSKEKWYARLTDPDLAQQVQTTLPRIGYDLITMAYASERKLGTMNRYNTVNTANSNVKLSTYEGVPYDLSFELAIYSRNAAEASKIIEQILPFFTPEFTLTLNNVTEHNLDIDVPIRFDGISREDAYEGDFETTRTLIWTLNFTMKTQFFGPVDNPRIVKRAYVDFFIPDSFIRYHSGTLAQASNTSHLYLQADTASREDGVYAGEGYITITGEGSGNTGITGNTSQIISYDGDTQVAVISPAFANSATAEWTYRIQYRATRNQGVDPDQLAGVPTASRIYIEPGLTANGDPTTNSALSVSVDAIEVDDDWGFVANTIFFPDSTLAGTRRNLETGEDEDL